jgi:pimeloyl-ACP methyl ester carboxylesterase
MKHDRRRLTIAVFFLTVLLSVPVVADGCKDGRPGRVSYVVKQGGRGGTVIGAQSVTRSRNNGQVEYKSVERRPYLVYDTTAYRNLTVSSEGKRMSGYYSNIRVPGASFRTYLSGKEGHFVYLADDLQTFDYVPSLVTSGSLFLFEPDSACLMQSLADRFFAEGKQRAVMFVIIPSISSVARQIVVNQEGRNALNVTGENIDEVKMKFDDEGVLAEASGAGVFIEKGRTGSLKSKPFQPGEAAGTIKEVRVQTPDKLSDGDRLELAGSLYLPSGKSPHRAVVLAGEFGPQDRTGGGFLSQLAQRLVGDGMAVLVCDRRGIPWSQGSYATYTLDSYVSDLNAEVDFLFLQGDIDIDHISMIGYGEGGIAAGRVAASNPYVSSLVLMATPSVPLFPDLQVEQVDRAAREGSIEGVEDEAKKLNINNLVSLLQQEGGDTVTLDGHKLFLGWMRSQSASSPLDSIAALDVPVLVVHGVNDDMVPVEQAQQLMQTLEARGPGKQELALFEGLGHDFGPFVSEGDAVPYRAHPDVDRTVLKKISGWLKNK